MGGRGARETDPDPDQRVGQAAYRPERDVLLPQQEHRAEAEQAEPLTAGWGRHLPPRVTSSTGSEPAGGCRGITGRRGLMGRSPGRKRLPGGRAGRRLRQSHQSHIEVEIIFPRLRSCDSRRGSPSSVPGESAGVADGGPPGRGYGANGKLRIRTAVKVSWRYLPWRASGLQRPAGYHPDQVRRSGAGRKTILVAL